MRESLMAICMDAEHKGCFLNVPQWGTIISPLELKRLIERDSFIKMADRQGFMVELIDPFEELEKEDSPEKLELLDMLLDDYYFENRRWIGVYSFFKVTPLFPADDLLKNLKIDYGDEE